MTASSPISTSASFLLVALVRGHRRALGRELAELGLHPGADLMLIELWREDELSQSELAERLGVSPPGVTKVVRGLERAGLVERVGDPDDRRVSRVQLTPAGAQLRRPVERAWREAERDTLRRLSSADKRALRRLLARALRS